MAKTRLLRTAADALVITAAAAVYALAFYFFFEANHLPMGGFSGIGQLLHRCVPVLTPGAVIFALNLPLMAVSVKKQGWRPLAATAFAICVTSLLMEALRLAWEGRGRQAPALEQPLLACIFGGLLCGASLGLMLRRNATTGGTELAARLLKYVFRTVSIGKLCLVIDVTVVFLYALACRQPEAALYGAVAMYVSSVAMDRVVYGAASARIACIVTGRGEEITRALTGMELGATVLNGSGAFTGAEKRVILCAVKPLKLARIKAAVAGIDPDAFIIVTDAREVYGQGFGVYDEDSL